MMRLSFLIVAACAPRWTQPEFRDEAKSRAIEAAALEHACPRERVSVRCDATNTTRARQLAYDEDGVIGTFVDEQPNWEIELDVCGHLKRYAYRGPEFGVVTLTGAPEHRGMRELARTCGGSFCLEPEPACTSCGIDHWWPVDVSIGPTMCANAPADPAVAIELDDVGVELRLRTSSIEVSRSCTEAKLFVAIDEQWFALCGAGVARFAAGETRVPTGITLGNGVHVIEAFSLVDGTCRRARPQTVDVSGVIARPRPITGRRLR